MRNGTERDREGENSIQDLVESVYANILEKQKNRS